MNFFSAVNILCRLERLHERFHVFLRNLGPQVAARPDCTRPAFQRIDNRRAHIAHTPLVEDLYRVEVAEDDRPWSELLTRFGDAVLLIDTDGVGAALGHVGDDGVRVAANVENARMRHLGDDPDKVGLYEALEALRAHDIGCPAHLTEGEVVRSGVAIDPEEPDDEFRQFFEEQARLFQPGTRLGPVLGGWFIDTLSWRYIFFINVPFAAAVVANVNDIAATGGRTMDVVDTIVAVLQETGLPPERLEIDSVRHDADVGVRDPRGQRMPLPVVDDERRVRRAGRAFLERSEAPRFTGVNPPHGPARGACVIGPLLGVDIHEIHHEGDVPEPVGVDGLDRVLQTVFRNSVGCATRTAPDWTVMPE